MTWKPKRPSSKWREFLNDREREIIELGDMRIETIRRLRDLPELVARQKIVNRAVHRAKYARDRK